MTPTPIPLTLEERGYFDAVYKLRDKYDRGFMSWSLMEESLKGLKPPAALAETHAQMVSAITDANFAMEMFRLSMMTYLLTYCSFSSWDYSLCILRQENARADAERYAAQVDAARARFRTLWAEAQDAWDAYRIARGAEPMPTATPFPLPPVNTPAPPGTAVKGVYETEITVTAVNKDAWSVIKAEDDSNDVPATGHKYIMVAVRVVNRASEPVWVHKSHFSLYANGTEYEEADQANPDDFEAKQLGPGESTSGNLSFEVPAEVSNAILLFLRGDLVLALQ